MAYPIGRKNCFGIYKSVAPPTSTERSGDVSRTANALLLGQEHCGISGDNQEIARFNVYRRLLKLRERSVSKKTGENR